jgi:hypothetical protein
MASFDYLKHKQKNLKFSRHHFGIQNSFWVKINLDPMVWRKGLNKINVCIIYNLQFFYDNKASCLWFMKHYQTKENWKNNAMPIHKISFSLI